MDPFTFLYNATPGDRAPFGDAWCGPAALPREGAVVARYPSEGGDGYAVEVTCHALPARFYKVRALSTPDSSGEERPGFVLSTGSGNEMAEWAALTARLISEGMISLRASE